MPRRKYWLSTYHMTVYVETDVNNRITRTAPITRKFIGQPITNLTYWLSKQGGLLIARLDNPNW